MILMSPSIVYRALLTLLCFLVSCSCVIFRCINYLVYRGSWGRRRTFCTVGDLHLLSSSVTSLISYIEPFEVTLEKAFCYLQHDSVKSMHCDEECLEDGWVSSEESFVETKGLAFKPNLIGGIRANRLSRQQSVDLIS